jgi:hypothetical protein
MTAMNDQVQENLKAVGARQKKWYDRNARNRSFHVGDQVLVLLPSSTSKLSSQWQGPYQVLRSVGEVNYLIYMTDHKKKKRVLHVNMLQKWHQPPVSVLLVQNALEEMDHEEVPVWNEADKGHVRMGSQLNLEQSRELGELLDRFKDVFQALPGHTTVTEQRIITGDARPARLAPYKLPHALREQVRQEFRGNAGPWYHRAVNK